MTSDRFSIESNNTTAAIINQAGNIYTGDILFNTEPQKILNTDDFDLPRLIETFKGRDEELNALESLFFYQNVKRVVISGLPGIGKSELAKQFAEQCERDGKLDHIFWIKAENKEELEKFSKQLKALYQKYKYYKCLYIFDNTISKQSIFELEPPHEDNCYLLITSQVKDWHDDIGSLELDHLSLDSAIEVFKTILNELYNEQDCSLYSEIAEIVNNIPLGLQVTAAYVRQRMKSTGQHFDLQVYVDEIKRNQHAYIDLVIPECVANSYTKSLYGAVKSSIDKVKSEKNVQIRELALNALFICAFLDPEDITLEDLLKMPSIEDLLTQYKTDKNILRQALTFIDNYSLMSFDPNVNKIILHRLIQEILRYHMRKCDSEMQSVCYSACLEALFNDVSHISKLYFYKGHTITLKYADDNVHIFYNFYQNHKKEFFLDGYWKILKHIFYCLIQWNCVNSLKRLLDDIVNHHIFNYIMCIRQCIRLSTYISNFELLHTAASCNNIRVMKFLLDGYNLDVNVTNSYHNTPLHTAAWNWNLKAIKFLINNNADLKVRNLNGDTPLFDFFRGARYREQIDLDDVIEILSLLNLEKNQKDINNRRETVLHASAKSFQANLVTLLITNYQLDVNAVNKDGETPLHTLIARAKYSSRHNDVIQTVKALKSYGARLDIRDSSGKTPWLVAHEAELTKYLTSYLIDSDIASISNTSKDQTKSIQ